MKNVVLCLFAVVAMVAMSTESVFAGGGGGAKKSSVISVDNLGSLRLAVLVDRDPTDPKLPPIMTLEDLQKAGGKLVDAGKVGAAKFSVTAGKHTVYVVFIDDEGNILEPTFNSKQYMVPKGTLNVKVTGNAEDGATLSP